MIDYVEDLLNDVMFRAPDVPDTILRQTIRDGAAEFFRESEVWRIEAQPIYTFEQVDTYEIYFESDVRIVRLHSVRIDQHPVKTEEVDQLSQVRGDAVSVTNDDPHRLLLAPHTTRGWAFVNASVAPSRSTNELPEHLVRDFRDPIMSAALSRIYGMPGSGWFDDSIASYYRASVQEAIMRGKRLVDNRRKETRRTVRYGGL